MVSIIFYNFFVIKFCRMSSPLTSTPCLSKVIILLKANWDGGPKGIILTRRGFSAYQYPIVMRNEHVREWNFWHERRFRLLTIFFESYLLATNSWKNNLISNFNNGTSVPWMRIMAPLSWRYSLAKSNNDFRKFLDNTFYNGIEVDEFDIVGTGRFSGKFVMMRSMHAFSFKALSYRLCFLEIFYYNRELY